MAEKPNTDDIGKIIGNLLERMSAVCHKNMN